MLHLKWLHEKWVTQTASNGNTLSGSLSISLAVPPIQTMAKRIHARDGEFVDESGRTVILRGINLDSSAKSPASPAITTYTKLSQDFWDKADEVSFVGSTFSSDEEAHAHLRRIKSWGYNVIRYVYTWEALEHGGPGVYDEDFIEYTIRMLKIIAQYGFYVVMDPHQDLWSRFGGGSGAPIWTYYACGLDPRGFQATEAAILQNDYDPPTSFPKMLWATNYARFAAATINTLFFAGTVFAPNAIIDGKNIQHYLQDHLLNAMRHLYSRIQESTDLFDTSIIGVETLNEPNAGYIGVKDIGVVPEDQHLKFGTTPSPLQTMLLASGYACEVDVYKFTSLGPKKNGSTVVDPAGVSAWVQSDHFDRHYGFHRDPNWKLGICIWQQNGVWREFDEETEGDKHFAPVGSDHSQLTRKLYNHTELLKPRYFSSGDGGIDYDEPYFVNTYFVSYWSEFFRTLRKDLGPKVLLFCQPPVLALPPILKGNSELIDNQTVYAPHFYDGITLMLKKWNRWWNVDCLGVLRGKYLTPALALKVGENAIRQCMCEQLALIRKEGKEFMGENIPCFMTETGMPMDMDEGSSFKTGDYSSQVAALDAISLALEKSGMSYTYWGYCSMNRHEQGDFWNGEDFSFWSNDLDGVDSSAEYHDVLDAGVRARKAIIRPFPVAVVGDIIEYYFDVQKRTFLLSIDGNGCQKEGEVTQIFLPQSHFHPREFEVELGAMSGDWSYDSETSILSWKNSPGPQSLNVRNVAESEAGGCPVM